MDVRRADLENQRALKRQCVQGCQFFRTQQNFRYRRDARLVEKTLGIVFVDDSLRVGGGQCAYRRDGRSGRITRRAMLPLAFRKLDQRRGGECRPAGRGMPGHMQSFQRQDFLVVAVRRRAPCDKDRLAAACLNVG